MFLTKLSQPSADERAKAESILQSVGDIAGSVQLGSEVLLLAKLDKGEVESVKSHLLSLNATSVATMISTPYVLSSRAASTDRTVVRINNDLVVGEREFVVMAGPCAVESPDQLDRTARAVRDAGARVLRGGAFKPRTSPFSSQGLGHEGLKMLAQARAATGLPIVSELLDSRELRAIDEHVDIIQIGMRNCLNYSLLKDVGSLLSRRPVLLKRGIGSTIDELLCAADYIMAGGNPNVILCLRGNVSFSSTSRSALNIADLPALRAKTHLPFVVDPSHVAGNWELVPAISAAAMAAGADGLLVEVHPNPTDALSDGKQSLIPARFEKLMEQLCQMGQVVGRPLRRPTVSPSDEKNPNEPYSNLCLEPPMGPLDDAGDHLNRSSSVAARQRRCCA